MKKILTVLWISVMAMGLLTACGTATNPQEETAEENIKEGTQVTGDNDSNQDKLSDGVLTVGTNAEFPPFEYKNEDGEIDGFDIALMNEIGQKVGVQVEIENMEFAALLSATGTTVDVVAAGMTITDERLEDVDFSDPYYEIVQYVVLSEGSDIATAEDLKNKTIGVQLGTTGDFIASEIEGSTVRPCKKAADAINDLAEGRVDCVIIDEHTALALIDEFDGKLYAVDGAQFEFPVEQYAIAMPKGDKQLVETLNQALKEIKEDGTFDELVKKYELY